MDLRAQLEEKRRRIAELRALSLAGLPSRSAEVAPAAAPMHALPVTCYDKAVETPPIAQLVLVSSEPAEPSRDVAAVAVPVLPRHDGDVNAAADDVAPLAFSLTQSQQQASYDASNDNDESPIVESAALRGEARLFNARHCASRAVMGMEFSPLRADLLLVVYSALDADAATDWQLASDPEGSALLWSLSSSEPEKALECEWALTCCAWSMNGLVAIAGAVNGAICMWDVRSPSSRPVHVVQGAHLFPVVGVLCAATLTSLSSDGKLCQWDAAALNDTTEAWRPSASVELTWEKREVGACCLALIGEDILVGCEAGFVYRVASDDGVVSAARRHDGPVTSVCFWPHPSSTRLVLSSSFDWTCAVHAGARTSSATAGNMVAHAGFSPVHPGVFASVDADGKLTLWAHAKGEWAAAASVAASPFALRRLAWTRDGARVCTGSTRGVVRVFALLAEELSMRGSTTQRERERIETSWAAL